MFLTTTGLRFSKDTPWASYFFTREIASNLHVFTQAPHPTHIYSSVTVAPQLRHRSVSFLTCSSVKVGRKSLKDLLASAPFTDSVLCLGSLSNPSKSIFSLSKAL